MAGTGGCHTATTVIAATDATAAAVDIEENREMEIAKSSHLAPGRVCTVQYSVFL